MHAHQLDQTEGPPLTRKSEVWNNDQFIRHNVSQDQLFTSPEKYMRSRTGHVNRQNEEDLAQKENKTKHKGHSEN